MGRIVSKKFRWPSNMEKEERYERLDTLAIYSSLNNPHHLSAYASICSDIGRLCDTEEKREDFKRIKDHLMAYTAWLIENQMLKIDFVSDKEVNKVISDFHKENIMDKEKKRDYLG